VRKTNVSVQSGRAVTRADICGNFSVRTGFHPRLLHVRSVWTMWPKEKCVLWTFTLLQYVSVNRTNIKFILLASQAQSITQYKNLRTKVIKCCANIYLNKQCLYNNVITKYSQIKVPSTSPASQSTVQKTKIMRIKEELKWTFGDDRLEFPERTKLGTL